MHSLKNRNRIQSCETGIVVPLAAATLVIVVGMTMLVTDWGTALMGRTDLSQAVDAAALAGAQELPDSFTAATAVATDTVNSNVLREMYGTPDVTVTFPASRTIRVTARSVLPARFSSAFGFDELGVSATAEAARLEPDLVLIIDRSGSMCSDSHPSAGANCPSVGPWEPFNAIQNAAKGFVDQMANSGGTMALLSYATDATLDVLPTTNDAVLRAAIDGLQPGGYTDIGLSLNGAIDALLQILGPNPKMIVLLTDGVPTSHNGRFYGFSHPIPVQAARDAAENAKDEGIPIFGISYGQGADQDLMDDLAETSEGKAYYAPDEDSLNVVYTEIADTAQIKLTWVD